MALPTLMLPDTVRPASYDIQRQTNVLSSVPITGAHRRQTRAIGEAYHTLSLKYHPMHRDEFAEIVAFVNDMYGMHSTFGVLIPNFTKDRLGAQAGNYLTLSTGKTTQLNSAGSMDNTQLYTAKTNASIYTFSNQVAVTSGVPVAVYVDVSGTTATSEIQMWSTNTGTTGSAMSDGFTLRPGRNLVMLTPSSSGGAYVRLKGSTITVTECSIKTGVHVGSNTQTMSPSLLAADDSAYILPAPAAILSCSLASNAQTVSYGNDSFIRMDLNLTERR